MEIKGFNANSKEVEFEELSSCIGEKVWIHGSIYKIRKMKGFSFDLLFRGLEITTGGQRIHTYDEQVNKMLKRNMHTELFESYLMMHKYGMPPHGGLGLGLERFTCKLLGDENVRYASLFPRDINRLLP